MSKSKTNLYKHKLLKFFPLLEEETQKYLAGYAEWHYISNV